ncbi:MAG: DNA repair protein RadA [Microgenomates group bacterium]|jgi:DNA repair protein RadA/Sms
MAKTNTSFICQQCGYHSPSFLGRCPECGTWNSLVETISEDRKIGVSAGRQISAAKIINLKDVEKQKYARIGTGLIEFDRVLGGGIVQGSVILVSGDPGIGKSTLLTQLALNVWQKELSSANNVLYIAGEESAHQIKLRTDRIKKDCDLAILNETDVDSIIDAIKTHKPELVIIDSIQTLETSDLTSAAGSVGQVRECAHRLQKLAKQLHIPILLVGHVTKEGNIAGPKTLEHLVDVVLSLEGDPTSNFRIIRASKNRFGSVDEVGIFEMLEAGMVEVTNPSKIFLEQRVLAPGSAVVATMGGIRPLLVEIQALVTKSFLPNPRRTGSGIDNNRLQLLVAVLSKRLGLPLYDQDIFVNVTGGMKVVEPAADLAICMSIVSSFKDTLIDPKVALVGEVGLLGELRSVRLLEKRKNEGKKLGFTKIVSPENVKSLSEVVKLLLPQTKS